MGMAVYESCLRRAMKYAPRKLSRIEVNEKFCHAAEKHEHAGNLLQTFDLPFEARLRWALMCRLVL